MLLSRVSRLQAWVLGLRIPLTEPKGFPKFVLSAKGLGLRVVEFKGSFTTRLTLFVSSIGPGDLRVLGSGVCIEGFAC